MGTCVQAVCVWNHNLACERPMMMAPPKHTHWVEDTAVSQCQDPRCTSEFGLLMRKHHCRRCGKIFCDSHSLNRMALDSDAAPDERGELSRVCDACFLGVHRTDNSASSLGASSGALSSVSPSGPSQREVVIQRPVGGGSLGMAVAKAAGASSGGRSGVLITSVVPSGPASKCRGLHSGDIIHSVNGKAVDDYQHATQLLLTAGASVKLTLSNGTLPKGWTAHTDSGGVVYYLNSAKQLKSRSHPSSVSTINTELREMGSEDMDGEDMGAA